MVHKAILSDLERLILKKVLRGVDVPKTKLGAYRVLKTKLNKFYGTIKKDFDLIERFMDGKKGR